MRHMCEEIFLSLVELIIFKQPGAWKHSFFILYMRNKQLMAL